MAGAINVNPQARDLIFTFNDSCNCCCFGRKPTIDPDTEVYVNEKGEVRRFDSKRAADTREALKRSMSNLYKILERMSEDRHKNLADTIQVLEQTVTPLDLNNPSPLTARQIDTMISLVKSPGGKKVTKFS